MPERISIAEQYDSATSQHLLKEMYQAGQYADFGLFAAINARNFPYLAAFEPELLSTRVIQACRIRLGNLDSIKNTARVIHGARERLEPHLNDIYGIIQHHIWKTFLPRDERGPHKFVASLDLNDRLLIEEAITRGIPEIINPRDIPGLADFSTDVLERLRKYAADAHESHRRRITSSTNGTGYHVNMRH